jgi:hypothetical protein
LDFSRAGYGEAVGELPQGIDRDRHVELRGRTREPWVRRIVLAVIVAFLGLGLASVFGQRATTSSASGPAASLTVEAPAEVRGGLLAQGLIRVEARRRIAKPRLVLSRGWIEGITINTIIPEAADQEDGGDHLTLAYGELPAGDTLTVRIQFQVNPTTVHTEPQDVELRDGDVPLARVSRRLTVFP